VFLAQVVLQLIGYQSLVLAIVLTGAMVVLAVIGGWPWLKRWRPFTFVPANGNTRQAKDGEPQQVGIPTTRQTEVVEQLKVDKEQLETQLDEARWRYFSEDMREMVSRRFMHHCAFRLTDLLWLVSEDKEESVIHGFKFEHCTIRGPGVITLEGEVPGGGHHLTVSPGRTCHFEGSPESVFHEVQAGGKEAEGLVRLVGCAFRHVTFENIGVAGTSEELLQWWGDCTFSSGESPSWEPKNGQFGEQDEHSATEWDVLKEESEQRRIQRDAQLRQHCFYLSENLRRFLAG
jgi:hypothetical protein